MKNDFFRYEEMLWLEVVNHVVPKYDLTWSPAFHGPSFVSNGLYPMVNSEGSDHDIPCPDDA